MYSSRSFSIVLTVSILLVCILVSAFNLQTFHDVSNSSITPYVSSAKMEFPDGLDSAYRRFVNRNVLRSWESGGSCMEDDESPRLIVCVNTTRPRIDELRDFITRKDGNITGTISADGNIRALTVEASPDDLPMLADSIQRNELVQYVGSDFKVNASFVPNDPRWSAQWGPKKIEADWAWNSTIGSSDILVAIIDSGVDYTHEDLATCYVPLGYDWVNGDSNPMDDNGHGTHCAGIAAARFNNSKGIAGIAQVRIMTEKVLDAFGSGFYSWLTEGIYHAVDVGAKIISMSLGGVADSPLLHDAVKYAYDHDVLVVAAAGNAGTEAPHYPAYYDEVVAVSATDSNDNLASFSTFGDWIDLAAPGVDILSTFPDNTYTSLSGTSMACPHVTGVASLTWSAFPNSTANEIRKIMERTADDLGEVGFDKHFGNGRINARRAVAGIPEHDVCITRWKQAYRLDPGEIGTFNVTVSNYGRNNETDVAVQFFVNESLVDSEVIGSLEVDASTSFSFSWGTTTNGVYNVTCYVVPVQDENATWNNVAYAELAVRFPATLRVPNDYSTIKTALGAAFPADVVAVSEGCYSEGQIDLLKDNITLVADGRVILDGSLGGYVLSVMADYVTVDGFNIQNGSSYGIRVKGCGNVIMRNSITRTSDGVYLHNSEYCVLDRNFIVITGDGMDIYYSSNNTVSRNKVVASSFFGGLNLWKSSNNNITLNTLTGGILCGAILVCASPNNFIASNNITGNRCGMTLVGSTDNVLRNNTMTRNWCNFAPWRSPGPVYESLWKGSNDIDTSNTVDGKPIYYWVNVRDRTIPSDAGCVVLANCENIMAENLDIKNNYNGMLLVNSSSILIRRNNISHNWANFDTMSSGIMTFSDSYNITITQNNITANCNGLILWGHNNTVTHNNLANSFDCAVSVYDDSIVSENIMAGNEGVAVYIHGSNCIVSSNNITANLNVAITVSESNHTIVSNNIVGYARPFENIYGCSHEGIFLSGSNCTIRSNNIMKRDDAGIATYSASGNMIFHNNFVNNLKPFYSYSPESTNTWNDGYPSGGNYWSSYTGADNKSGPNQDQQGADGIGDTPYVLGTNSTDSYPLMTPTPENPVPQTFCLTITGVISGSPIEGFYNTPYPRPGTYLYMANSTIQVDTQMCWGAFIEHWELDGVNVGSASACTVVMNKDHTLKAVFTDTLPLAVSIAPTHAEVKVGEPITFKSLGTGGGEAYSYQWYLNGPFVWDATSPEWTFTPETADSYIVRLDIASYPSTTGESNNVSLIVRPQPPVYVLPTTSFKLIGDSIMFTSTVSGMNPPYSYQWYLNGSTVPEATLPTLTYVPDTRGFYTVSFNVTDNLGFSMMSDEASVTVASPPTASISPTSSAIYFGETIQFTSAVSDGYPPYLYQWVLNETTLTCTTPSFTFASYPIGQYTVHLKVTDIFGTIAESNEASITVNPELAVSASPPAASMVTGKSIEFTATPSEGSSPQSYQWYLDGKAVSGATSLTWVFTSNITGYHFIYVNMTDKSGKTVRSNTATATVYLPSDVDRNGIVNMRDIGACCNAFGSTPGHPKWSPNADINEDGVVNMRDIGTVCNNFGKT